MINLTRLNEIQVIVFALIMLRMIAFVFSSAILSSSSIPVIARILFSLILTMIVYGTVAQNTTIARVAQSEEQIILLAFYELIIGLSLGFLTRLFFFSVSMAGDLMSISLGLGQAQIFNPMSEHHGSALEQFLLMFSTIVFLLLNGHHLALQGLVQSFHVIPLADVHFNAQQYKNIVLIMQELLSIALRLSAPVVVSMLVVQISVGLLSRAVPHINVLSTASSVSALLGILLIMICLPLMASQMNGVLELTNLSFFNFIKGM